MNRKTFYSTMAAVALWGSSAFACTEADVQARQGAFLEAMQTLLASDPVKAQQIFAQMKQELDQAAATGDTEAPCEMLDRLTAEALENA